MYNGIIGFLFVIIIILSLVVGTLLTISPDQIQIRMYQNFEPEYYQCQQSNQQLNNQLEDLQQTKSVVCQCSECNTNLAMVFWAFILGAMASGYSIIALYPTVKKKLEEKNQPKKKTKRKTK